MPITYDPKTLAMNIRNALYDSKEGALMHSYPNGSGTRPVLVPIPEEQREEAKESLARLLKVWEEIDFKGYRLWRSHSALLDGGGSTEPLKGWALHVFEESGLRLVDPCTLCRTCRKDPMSEVIGMENLSVTYSHWAVCTQGEPLDLRMDIEWTPDTPGVSFTLREMDSPQEVHLKVMEESTVIPDGTPTDAFLNSLVRKALAPHIPAGTSVENPITAFHRFALEWKFMWVNGRFA